MLLAAPYDLVICDEVMVAPYALAQSRSSSPPRLLIRPKIDHQHYRDLAAGRPWGLKKLLDWLEAARLQRYERLILPAFQQAVVCSAEDAAVTKAQWPTIAVEIIPNGADTEFFTPAIQAAGRRDTDADQVAQPPTILLLGTMHYYPNIDAVHYFFDTMYSALCARYPNLQVLIVGHQPPPEIAALAKWPGITVTGSVDEIRPYLARSSLLAVPLRLGGGTRLKIAEAMAAGLPVVATPIGAQGLAVEDEHHLLLAAEPTAFIAAIQRLLDDPSLGQRLAEAGRKLVESQYSWQTLGQRFTALCEAMVDAQRPNDHPTKRPLNQ
jgi:glycosyltransferase involved in cell wall biosynthesis